MPRRSASRKQVARFEQNVAKAQSKDSLKAFAKLTEIVDGELRIISDAPLIVPVEEVIPAGEHHRIDGLVQDVIRSYRRSLATDRRRLLERYRYVHMARKVVGVGSVGTRAWIMLLLGRDASDPLFLQLKEAEAVGARAVPRRERVRQPRPASGRGPAADAGRERHPARLDPRHGPATAPSATSTCVSSGITKGSALVEAMNPKALGFYAELCGRTLAKAHARSGDAVAIASYLGAGDSFDRALASFAERYADQNERDYRVLRDAVESGRLAAETGV